MSKPRIHICFTIFTLVIFILAGCLSGCDDGSNTSNDTSNTDNAVMADIKTIKICYMGYGDTGQPRNLKSINEMLDELNNRTEIELNTRVEFQWLPYMDSDETPYETSLTELLKTEDAPDAFMTYGGNIEALCNQGLVKDITEIIPEYLSGYYSMLMDAWGDELDNSCRYEDRIYTVPCNDYYAQRYCVIAREDLVEKYMPDGISDLNDYNFFLNAINENEAKSITPGMISPSDYFNAYMTGNGYLSYGSSCIYTRWDDIDINPVFMHQTYEFQEASGMYIELKRKGLLFDFDTKRGSDIQSGTLASTLYPLWFVQSHSEGFTSKYAYRMYPLYMNSNFIKPTNNGNSLAINDNSQNVERVLMFINWVQSSQENYDLLMYGIKGKHYDLSGNRLDFQGADSRNTVVNWWGSNVFKNSVYERSCSFEPEDASKFRKDCAFRNTISYYEFIDSKGYDEKQAQDSLSQDEKDRRSEERNHYASHITKIFDVYSEYFQMLQNGSGTEEKTIDQMIAEQGLEQDVDAVLDYFRTELERMKKR